jgi:hypothetical protein
MTDINNRLSDEKQSDRLKAGVVSAALAWSAPLETSTGWLVYIPGDVPKPDETRTTAWVDGISPATRPLPSSSRVARLRDVGRSTGLRTVRCRESASAVRTGRSGRRWTTAGVPGERLGAAGAASAPEAARELLIGGVVLAEGLPHGVDR